MIEQKYTIKKIHRSEIKNAEYNPRYISLSNQNRLKKILKKHGLVMPLIVNEKTGNLVSGHKRLEIIDHVNKKHNDYEIEVAVINVDEKEEKEINIALNNPDAMGKYDFDKIQEILVTEQIEPIDVGFDIITLEVNGVDLRTELTQQEQILQQDMQDISEQQEIKKVDEKMLRELNKKERNKMKDRDNAGTGREFNKYDHNIIFVFQDNIEKRKAMNLLGYNEEEKFADGKQLLSLLEENKNTS